MIQSGVLGDHDDLLHRINEAFPCIAVAFFVWNELPEHRSDEVFAGGLCDDAKFDFFIGSADWRSSSLQQLHQTDEEPVDAVIPTSRPASPGTPWPRITRSTNRQ